MRSAPLRSDGLGCGDQFTIIWKAQRNAPLTLVVQRLKGYRSPIDGFFIGHRSVKILIGTIPAKTAG
jgi:hypothetical protein